ncbi:hypothetical protein [Massilia sp. CF038]|uniref:hypothetical protein n=1 Tax=Massilia sp. CF038 TaxID=1881045 RepID=UPI000934854B|nr:hypothetical protein [Massilia sp. CF038]
MSKLTRSQWAEFQNTMAEMDDDSSPREILNVILGWLRKNSEIFSDEPFSIFGINRFLELREENCPVESSPMHGVEFANFRKIIKKYGCDDIENIARYLRDTLETLVVMEADRQCPRCERWGMGIYTNSEDGRMAFECRQCGYGVYTDGSRVGANELTFASTEGLRGIDLL